MKIFIKFARFALMIGTFVIILSTGIALTLAVFLLALKTFLDLFGL